MQNITVSILRLPHSEGLELPRRETLHSAGLDLMAANATEQPIILESFERVLVPTGLILQIPAGFEGQVRPRSGLALRHGITVANAPGTIDADYRGELKVLLVNLGKEPFEITRGMRVAQLVIAPVVPVVLDEVKILDETERGDGGFGSTGLLRP